MTAIDIHAGQPASAEAATSVPFGMFQAIDGEDWPTLAAMFHPTAIYERPGYAPLLGRDEIMEFYRNVRNVRVGRHQVVDIVQDADTVVCQGRFSCHTKDGARLNAEFCDIYALKDGQIRRRKTYFYKETV
ncbi:nuclear transport factor 2 family protein [Stappia indica]|uniref:nuclear transport factor 2 family protein n=1 Tax=Stappia indica TaxID=538381 RepID=UPI001CD4A504|nr:nuclear transport factor 2 family protein [Stappia indica]MCA1298587.1 nuclear transport factor 2 family protein [Stappia indica]